MYTSNEIIESLDNNMNYIDWFHIWKIALLGSFARDELGKMKKYDRDNNCVENNFLCDIEVERIKRYEYEF